MKSRIARLCLVASCGAVLLIAFLAVGFRTADANELRLVVLLVVDGLPQQQLAEAERLFADDGIGRLIRAGAWFTDARYAYAPTFTAAGHATIVTGANPYRHGIVSNDWLDLEGNRTYCTEDRDHRPLGEAGSAHSGVSPRNLRSTTLGDTLRLSFHMTIAPPAASEIITGYAWPFESAHTARPFSAHCPNAG